VVAAPSAEDNTHTNSNQVDSTATTTAPAPPPLSSATLPSIDEAAALVVSTTLGFENLPVTPENGNGNGNVSESKKVTRKVSISNGQQDDRRGSHPGSSSDDSSGEDSSKSRKLDYRKTALLELQLGMGTMAMNTEDATGDETEDETYRARGWYPLGTSLQSLRMARSHLSSQHPSTCVLISVFFVRACYLSCVLRWSKRQVCVLPR
jgi:hypothetical protein